MGNKGAKITQNSIHAAEQYVEKLKTLEGITSKKMFGGFGIFYKKKMFSIIDSNGKHFLKINEANRSDFEKSGSYQHSRMPYFSIPDDILKNNSALLVWVKKAIGI